LPSKDGGQGACRGRPQAGRPAARLDPDCIRMLHCERRLAVLRGGL